MAASSGSGHLRPPLGIQPAALLHRSQATRTAGSGSGSRIRINNWVKRWNRETEPSTAQGLWSDRAELEIPWHEMTLLSSWNKWPVITPWPLLCKRQNIKTAEKGVGEVVLNTRSRCFWGRRNYFAALAFQVADYYWHTTVCVIVSCPNK